MLQYNVKAPPYALYLTQHQRAHWLSQGGRYIQYSYMA